MTNGHKITDKLAEIHGNEDFNIAFLPYKRSMWSSMKSVYESCKNAHIYPLPYYLINHKGLVERLAKDNFDNAEDIKTLKKADFLVIHYPYDSHNAVTQMLPQYYIRNLKRFGKVIYIPYARVGLDFLWNQPGLGYVDYVFLNTEEDSERFKALWKSKGVDFEGRAFGLGSPKLVHNPGRTQCQHLWAFNLISHVELVGLVIVAVSQSKQLVLLQRMDKRRERTQFPCPIQADDAKAYDGSNQQKEGSQSCSKAADVVSFFLVHLYNL